jgi:hypothetical protein
MGGQQTRGPVESNQLQRLMQTVWPQNPPAGQMSPLQRLSYATAGPQGLQKAAQDVGAQFTQGLQNLQQNPMAAANLALAFSGEDESVLGSGGEATGPETIRLYRRAPEPTGAVAGDKPHQGLWFTANKEYAENFNKAAHPDWKIYYVDLPSAEAQKYLATGEHPMSKIHVLPRDVAAQASELQSSR